MESGASENLPLDFSGGFFHVACWVVSSRRLTDVSIGVFPRVKVVGISLVEEQVMRSGRDCFCWVLFPLVLLVISGCSGPSLKSSFQKANENNIERIANAYRMFSSINKHVGPKDEEEFKNFFRTDERIAPRLGLDRIDTDNIDSYFTSSADNEPFVILYGQKIRPDFDYSAIVFDKTGVNGIRRIALACSEVIEVDNDKQYDRILAGKIQKKDVPAHVFGGGVDLSLEEGAAR